VTEAERKAAIKRKKKSKKKLLGFWGLMVAFFIFVVLLVNSLLSIFVPHYYPTFGSYKFVAVTTSAMGDAVPNGSMLIVRKPPNSQFVSVGDIITFETDDDHGITTHTLRVVAVDRTESDAVFTAVGDGTGETLILEYKQIVGVYTGKKCGFFGYFFGFFNSAPGAVIMIVLFAGIVVFYILTTFLRLSEERRKLQADALGKCARELSGVNLRFDNIREITAVMDVLNMITVKPNNRSEAKETEKRLHSFIDAENIELPQTPEIAAVLDTLPAPDTPLTLAAALRNGATLRQAEDGQTLILTGLSGGRSIMLTPIQTSDGIVLCQQGVRLRADVAPNIETVGAMSMPEYPEFFEGQPIKKNVVYPELPQPSYVFGAEMLSPHNSYVPGGEMLASLMSAPASAADAAALGGGDRQALPSHQTPSAALPEHAPSAAPTASPTVAPADKVAPVPDCAVPAESEQCKDLAPPDGEADDVLASARAAYAEYRAAADKQELKQTEELNTLLGSVIPLTADEQALVDKYKKASGLDDGAKPKKPTPPDKLAARRDAAAMKKAEQDGFAVLLVGAEKERYLTEQKLAKTRADAVKRLKRISADRKLLDKIK